ncbi:MAG: type IV toxin-antitoxin system AbiEi family antitoxin [Candidatus Omnitrophota bacterium]
MNNVKKTWNVFADKATFILRKMLSDPKREWVTRDFIEKEGVSVGMAQGILEAMAKAGYIERSKQGPKSFSVLTNKEKLFQDWCAAYQFDLNKVDTFYSSDKNILGKLKEHLKDKDYAFTLHAGANLMTSFVITDHVHFYLQTENWEKDVLDLRQKLDLKELVRGGNIHIVRPHYKKSVFINSQAIKGCKVVSNLQLSLDLYGYQPRGQEQADYLKNVLAEKGKSFYES